jgi:hypothetical protein
VCKDGHAGCGRGLAHHGVHALGINGVGVKGRHGHARCGRGLARLRDEWRGCARRGVAWHSCRELAQDGSARGGCAPKKIFIWLKKELRGYENIVT